MSTSDKSEAAIKDAGYAMLIQNANRLCGTDGDIFARRAPKPSGLEADALLFAASAANLGTSSFIVNLDPASWRVWGFLRSGVAAVPYGKISMSDAKGLAAIDSARLLLSRP